jgi:ABC-type cobalamin transport system ATPase subunit
LNLAAVRVDVEDFLAQATDALDADRANELDATARLAAAVTAHTGDFLEEDPYQEWAAALADEVRDLMRSLAAQGRTVLVSSRDLGEMALTADQLLIVDRGELITEVSAWELTERLRRDVFVRSSRRSGLTTVLTGMGATVLAEPGVDCRSLAWPHGGSHRPPRRITYRSRN